MVLDLKKSITILFMISMLITPLIFKELKLSSESQGILIFLFLGIMLLIIKKFKIYHINNASLLFISTVMMLIYMISIFSFIIHPDFNFNRFISSYLYLCLLIFVSYIFAGYFLKVDTNTFQKISKLILFLLLFDGTISSFLISLRIKDNKSTLFFSEPSHYALLFMPFYIYFLIVKPKWRKILFIVSIFIAIFIQNLTLLVGIIFFTFMLTKPKYKLILISLVGTIFLILPNETKQYFLDRLNLFDDPYNIKNISVLAYLSGWERAYLNILYSHGLGVGFNQFGYVGKVGVFQDILASMGLPELNLYDGTTNGSKLISELGILGVFLILLYVYYFFKILNHVKHCININPIDAFFESVFLSYIMLIFVRAKGYFDVNTFLFFISIFYPSRRRIFHKSFLDIKMFNKT